MLTNAVSNASQGITNVKYDFFKVYYGWGQKISQHLKKKKKLFFNLQEPLVGSDPHSSVSPHIYAAFQCTS